MILSKEQNKLYKIRGDVNYEIYRRWCKYRKNKKAYEYYPLDGVTTNPSILAKSGRKPYEVLKEIREFIGSEAELHVQVVAKDAEGMIKDAQRITEELGKIHL